MTREFYFHIAVKSRVNNQVLSIRYPEDAIAVNFTLYTDRIIRVFIGLLGQLLETDELVDEAADMLYQRLRMIDERKPGFEILAIKPLLQDAYALLDEDSIYVRDEYGTPITFNGLLDRCLDE